MRRDSAHAAVLQVGTPSLGSSHWVTATYAITNSANHIQSCICDLPNACFHCTQKYSSAEAASLPWNRAYGLPVSLNQLLSQLHRLCPVRAIGRSLPALCNGCLQRREKSLARFAPADVLFQFVAHRIIKFLVEIV